MNKRYIGIIIIITGLVLILAIIYITFFHNFASDTEVVEETPITNNQEEETPQVIVPSQEEIEESVSNRTSQSVTINDLERIASSFSERFGSYSNHSDYQNIKDLRIFMTDSMKNWADSYVADQIRNQTDSTIYYGITTKAVSVEMTSYDEDEGTAQARVETQRRESTGVMANSSVSYQAISINFKKVDGMWKVDGAYWQ